MIKKLLNENRRLLSESDIYGKYRLKIFDKIGLESSFTDFAICSGGLLCEDSPIYQIKTNDETRQVVIGDKVSSTTSYSYFTEGIRLVSSLPFELEGNVLYDENNIPYVYYDEYIQTVARRRDHLLIEDLQPKTDNYYEVPNINDRENSYKSLVEEYKLNGNKYVRMKINNIGCSRILLSNGSETYNGDYKSFVVEPIKWYLDEETGLLVSEKILSSCLPYDYATKHKDNVKRLTKKNKNN